MAKEKEQPKQEPNSDTAMVLFGESVQMLPKELEAMGLAGKVIAREIPGVVPDWKPVSKGDLLLGRCVDVREVETRFTKATGIMGSCAVFETVIPGGFRTVWLGADLKIKLRDSVGKVYSIMFDGTMSSNKGQDMKLYRVMEVIPAQEH